MLHVFREQLRRRALQELELRLPRPFKGMGVHQHNHTDAGGDMCTGDIDSLEGVITPHPPKRTDKDTPHCRFWPFRYPGGGGGVAAVFSSFLRGPLDYPRQYQRNNCRRSHKSTINDCFGINDLNSIHWPCLISIIKMHATSKGKPVCSQRSTTEASKGS